ncbi:helix-turn-helix domain-containing protein [Mammaliicoccus sciuri]|uniref:helix-turn-helix domain-containing protein n=1 Tax=Mammaliicoccus sciuri TaxID=1296 RepID=UPI0034DD3617
MRTNDEIIDLMQKTLKEKNMSISELARQVGMAKSAVSRYMNKTREFPLNRAEDFAKALGISTGYLLGFLETNKTDDNVAAHVDGDFTEEEIRKIREYAALVRKAREQGE